MPEARTVRELGFVVAANHEANEREFVLVREQIVDSEGRIMERLSQNGIGVKQRLGAKKTTGIAVAGGTPIAAVLYLVVQDLLARV